jgi:deoxyadenosine/deoxycytidine kinase
MKKEKKFIAIAGNIGSGKSTLTMKLAEKLGWKAYYESVNDNPYLKDFYADMSRWSFNLQVYFLSHRFKTHKKILSQKYSVIQDRSIYEDVEIFARNLFELGKMNRRDYSNYKKLFSEMAHFLNPPDLLVYLKADVKTLVNQIKRRGREFERDIDVSYLERLNESYKLWIERYDIGEKLIIETDKLDFVNEKKHFNKILQTIKEKIEL